MYKQQYEPKFFFCYNVHLFKFLRFDKGVPFITCALHEKTKKKFWMFLQTEELNKYIQEYKEKRKKEIQEMNT